MRTCRKTRSCTGARLAFASWFSALVVLWCSPAVAERYEVGELPWRVGGDVGFTVDAAAFPDSADGYMLMVYVRVPPTTLDALIRDENQIGRFRLTATLKGAYGGKKAVDAQDFQVEPNTGAEGFGKVVQKRFVVGPGAHELEVRLEDLLSKKRGLIYLGRTVHVDAKVKGELEVPEPQDGRSISNVEFVWAEQSGMRLSPFFRHDRMVLPNADRLYGLFETTLRAHFRARASMGDDRPWRWVARLLDHEGRQLSRVDSTNVGTRLLEAGLAMDLRGLPAGGYDLEIKAWQEGDEEVLLRSAHFSIAWEKPAWLNKTSDIEDIVHFLLQSEEEEQFRLLHPGEQERYMVDYWEKRDPNPETPFNEAQQIYLARVQYANENFGQEGILKGMFTDRGRVYIRYGEPTEILQQVIPAGNETLEQMIYELSYTEDRSPEHILENRAGDMRPFEVWNYTGNIPLPVYADPTLPDNVRRHHLVFLFVDEQGLGNYTLRYSTE